METVVASRLEAGCSQVIKASPPSIVCYKPKTTRLSPLFWEASNKGYFLLNLRQILILLGHIWEGKGAVTGLWSQTGPERTPQNVQKAFLPGSRAGAGWGEAIRGACFPHCQALRPSPAAVQWLTDPTGFQTQISHSQLWNPTWSLYLFPPAYSLFPDNKQIIKCRLILFGWKPQN